MNDSVRRIDRRKDGMNERMDIMYYNKMNKKIIIRRV